MNQPKLTREFLQHRQSLLGFIFALTRDQVAAEEVFQEVALAILEEAASGTKVDPFLPWAREIARRRVLEYYRKSSRRGKVTPLNESMVDLVGRAFSENEEAPEADARRLACLRECLQRLPARARQVIDLRYNVRLGIEAIARSLSWQEGSIHVLLARTRKTLAECVRGKLSASEVT